MNYTDRQIELLIEGVFSGRFNPSYELPEDLYFAIADYLKKGLYKGFGATLADVDFDSPDYALLSELRNNVYMFSGAKTYQQIREMSELLTEYKTFSDFAKQAREIYQQYNENWLQSEYNTSIGQAQQAQQWLQFEQGKEQFPYLRYIAVMDSNTSEICRPLNGVTLPVGHALWDKYSPLNHFNCRCVLEKLSKYDDVEPTKEGAVKKVEKELNETVQPEFKMNPGKDGYIFSDKHPYFTVAKKDKGFARDNFGLPIPEKD